MLATVGPSAQRRGLDRERGFGLLLDFYQAHHELDRIAVLLTEQWQGLLATS